MSRSLLSRSLSPSLLTRPSPSLRFSFPLSFFTVRHFSPYEPSIAFVSTQPLCFQSFHWSQLFPRPFVVILSPLLSLCLCLSVRAFPPRFSVVHHQLFCLVCLHLLSSSFCSNFPFSFFSLLLSPFFPVLCHSFRASLILVCFLSDHGKPRADAAADCGYWTRRCA